MPSIVVGNIDGNPLKFQRGANIININVTRGLDGLLPPLDFRQW